MLKIAILDDYQEAALRSAPWHNIPDTEVKAFTQYIADENVLLETLEPFDVIVAMRERTPFPASLLAKLPNLKLLVTTAMRNLAIDMEYAKEKGILVCGTDMVPHSTYEHTWALILALAKNIPEDNALLHAGGGQANSGIGLKGKTLGVLGLGRLGKEVARIGQAFGMNVIAWSQNLNAEQAAALGYSTITQENIDATLAKMVQGTDPSGMVTTPQQRINSADAEAATVLNQYKFGHQMGIMNNQMGMMNNQMGMMNNQMGNQQQQWQQQQMMQQQQQQGGGLSGALGAFGSTLIRGSLGLPPAGMYGGQQQMYPQQNMMGGQVPNGMNGQTA